MENGCQTHWGHPTEGEWPRKSKRPYANLTHLPHLTIVDSLPKAIEIAHSQAQQFQAQVVLFSPGFSSFDLYQRA